VRLYDAEDPPRELLGPRLPAAPVGWRCVTPGLEFLEWPSPWMPPYPVGGIRHDGGHQA